jgi:glycine/D-amino acid oxidase-like deaminating enzyme
MENAGYDARVTEEGKLSIMQGALALDASLSRAQLLNATACLRPVSADRLPLLGPVPGWEDVYLATGAGRNGILLSAIIGKSIAELLVRGESSFPLTPFSPSRFL